MPLSSTTITVTDASDKDYVFTFDWLRVSHIGVTVNGTTVPSSQFTITGTSPSSTMTLTGDAATNLAVNDEIIISKSTPNTFATRTVDFASSGVVTEATLDDAVLHNISLAQDAIDLANSSLKEKDPDTTLAGFDARGLRIQNGADGVNATDFATVSQISSIVTGAGNLPGVTSADTNSMLYVRTSGGATAWSTIQPTDVPALIGLSSFVNLDVGTDPNDVLQTKNADTLYLQVANNLSDVTAATARDNLGLKTAAVEDVGVTANDVVQLDASARLPSVDGRNLDLSSHALHQKSGGHYDVFAHFPIPTGTTVTVDNAGITSDDFEDDSGNNIAVAALVEPWNNSTPAEVTVDTGLDTINLGAGLWEVEISMDLLNTASGASVDRFGWALVRHDTNAVLNSLKRNNSTRTVMDRSSTTEGHSRTLHVKTVLNLGASTAIAFRMAAVTGASIEIDYGFMSFRRLE